MAEETSVVSPASEQPIPFSTSDLGVDLTPAANTPAAADTFSAQEYGFDDENVRQYEFELYKGRKGITDRIGILSLPLGARCHFKDGIGYFVCMSTFQMKNIGGQNVEVCLKRSPCCLHTDGTRKRFIVPIIQYSTKQNGEPLPEFSYVLKAWMYSDDKYITMRTIHSEFPLLDHDLLITCTEENFQKLTISACRMALWKSPKLPQQMRDEITQWVQTMRPRMSKMLGKKITEDEFLKKVGLAPQTPIAPAMDAAMVDVKGLLDET